VRAELALAFTAGALAAFNPCGFALLPGYLTMFLGERSSRGTAVLRAVYVGALLTLGFVATFGLVGVAVLTLSLRLGTWLSLVTVLLGVGLIAIGVLTARGREPVIRLPRARLRVDSSPVGMASYGVVYATVSLSCTLPVFLAAVGAAFGTSSGDSGGLGPGIAALLAYSLGMGAVMTVLAAGMALLGATVPSALGRIRPYLGRVSAAFLILAGAYLTWYGWVEFQSFRGQFVDSGPTRWVADASAWASQVVLSIPAPALAVTAVGTLAAATLIARRGRPAHPTHGHPSPERPSAAQDAPQPQADPS
jgi:cytochrome c-type biogenesis protein